MKIKIKPNETIPNQTNSNQTKFYCLKKNLLVKIFGQKKHFWLRQKKFRKKNSSSKNFAQKKFCSKKILAKEIWQKNLVEIDFLSKNVLILIQTNLRPKSCLLLKLFDSIKLDPKFFNIKQF